MAESKVAVFDYDTIIINLKTLAKIHNDQKLYLAQKDLLEIDNYYLMPVRRTIYNMFWDGYNREAITAFIDNLIHSITITAENLIREYRKLRRTRRSPRRSPDLRNDSGRDSRSAPKATSRPESRPESPQSVNFSDTIEEKIRNLNVHVRNSIEGLQNLAITYKDDTKIKAHIDNLVGKLRNLITKLENLFMLKH